LVSRGNAGFLLVIFQLVFSQLSFAQTKLNVGDSPQVVELRGENGGRLNGEAWSSSELKDKVHVLMYIDPDHRNDNEALQYALREQAFGPENLGSVAIINMAGTWLPNAAIGSSLAAKQKEFPHTVYAKDFKRHLVKTWGLTDDSYCVLLFDKSGKLIFRKDGKLTDAEVKDVIKLSWQQIDPSKQL
jgi:predicted transcriptional regulator